MPKFNIFYVPFIALLFSCTDAKETKYLIKSLEADDMDEYALTIDSIRIPRVAGVNMTYHTYALYEKDNINYLFGYNPKSSTIDVIDINKRTVFNRLDLARDTNLFKQLDPQDLDKGRSITDINVVNFDSIILNYSNRKLVVMDTSVTVKKIIDLEDLAYQNGMTGRAISYSHNFKSLFFNDQLLFNHFYPDNRWKKKVEIVSSLNLATEKLTPIPITYSDYFYHIGGKAGFLNSVLTSEFQKKDVLTYSFLYESNIYQYDRKNETITCYGAMTSKGKNIVDSMEYEGDDLKKWEKHNIENTQFLNVMYDKYRHLYYRFSLRGIPYKNGKYFSSALDKPLTLMVFNEKFEVVKEMDLPSYVYSASTWFITQEGLFISPTNQKNTYSDPNHLRFHIIKLNKKTI